MAENRGKCYECRTTVTHLIREYDTRKSSSNDKNYFIGGFATGLPNFSTKKSAENKWTLQKEGHGRRIADAIREKCKNKPRLLEDENRQYKYHGQPEDTQLATYYLLMMQGKELVAIPVGSWYNFNKIAQYKQLTLDEAEEKIKDRRETADDSGRWMMKTVSNGSAAFGKFDKFLDKKTGACSGGRGRKKSHDNNEGNASDRKGGEDEDEVAHRLDLDSTKKVEMIMLMMVPEEAIWKMMVILRKDDDDDGPNEENGLSESGRELKKVLGWTNKLNDYDVEDDDNGSVDEKDCPSRILAPKLKDTPKEKPNNRPLIPIPGRSARGTLSTSESAKTKRKLNDDDTKATNYVPSKRVKIEKVAKSLIRGSFKNWHANQKRCNIIFDNCSTVITGTCHGRRNQGCTAKGTILGQGGLY